VLVAEPQGGAAPRAIAAGAAFTQGLRLLRHRPRAAGLKAAAGRAGVRSRGSVSEINVRARVMPQVGLVNAIVAYSGTAWRLGAWDGGGFMQRRGPGRARRRRAL
jgi:hypothetical protein